MMNLNQKQAIRELLLKYTDPKPGFDGMTAHELTEKIFHVLDDEPSDTILVREGEPEAEVDPE